MGLSYAQYYTWTSHFEQRAFERFGVDKEHLKKWINKSLGTLEPYDTTVMSNDKGKPYLSADTGIVLVCNEVERKFVTCYQAQDALADEEYHTIHQRNKALYDMERQKLKHHYIIKDAKDLLTESLDDITRFQELANHISRGRLSERNYELLTELQDEYHVIKATMRQIEGKRKDFD